MSLLRDGFRSTVSVFSAVTGAGAPPGNIVAASRATSAGGPTGTNIVPTFPLISPEREVQPPALDGKGPIEISTMRNTFWRTQVPKSLVGVDDLEVTCEIDPIVYEILGSLIQVNVIWRVDFPDLDNLCFYGWLEKMTPSKFKEGDLPLNDLKIMVSNVYQYLYNGVTVYGEVGPYLNGNPLLQRNKGNAQTPPGNQGPAAPWTLTPI